MSKVYFATKDDLNTEINNINTSLGDVQTDLNECNNTALSKDSVNGIATNEDINTMKSEIGAKIDTINETIASMKGEVYEFTINQAESDPASMITYGGKNADYIPAKMNYDTDTFDYGSWKDAFFIKGLKPVVLGYDGSVISELNPDDYTKTVDGSDSGITSTSLNGNVMVGIPKTYIKTVTNGDSTTVYISNKKLDDDYHCYAHIDYNEQEQDYAYLSAYSGCIISDKMRSLSGKNYAKNRTATEELEYTVANNTDTSIKRWYVETYSIRCLITFLLMLISRSTDSQTAFGKGTSSYYLKTALQSGTMDDKGLFWGSSKNDQKLGVKVFGIENFWGNIHTRIAGMISVGGVAALKAKMCWGTSDGSTTKEYNLTGDGYREYANIAGGAYIRKMDFTNGTIVPTQHGGSATTYYCDHLYNNQNSYSATIALCGGWNYDGQCNGAFCFDLGMPAEATRISYGTSIIFI